MPSDAQFHVMETARVAKAAHDRLMRDARAGVFPTLYVYYKTRRLECFAEGETPLGEGWTLAWPERVPGDKTAEQLSYWFAARTGRVPYLGDPA